MKKIIMYSVVFIGLFMSSIAQAEDVYWDNAIVVKQQVGKMTFSKDVKVYKKEKDGSFTSLTVKAGSFFRVYYVEQASVGIVYGMSNGYRVQSSELVIYKAVPTSVQSMFGVTVKESVMENTSTNERIKTLIMSDNPNSKAQRLINEQLQSLILEKTELDIAYTTAPNQMVTFYEYEILMNEWNRLTLMRQRSQCSELCHDVQYEYEIIQFHIATGERWTLEKAIPDKQMREKVTQLILAQASGMSMEQAQFYETQAAWHVHFIKNGQIEEIIIQKDTIQ